jgi:hypothetical protein
MQTNEAYLGLLALVYVFYDMVEERAVALKRKVPEARAGIKRVIMPANFSTVSTSVPRSDLFRRQLKCTVMRRGNHDSEGKICT